jgi:transcriptional regulator with XRE-family HTH domain
MRTTELLELNRIRLDEDLTYEELAEAIGIERTTLLRLLQSPNRKPYDRTLHKIKRFLDQHTTPRATRKAVGATR